jgi:curved DNA-binding protein CbpA
MARTDGVADLYDLLGVPSDADPPRIGRGYRELARALRLDVPHEPENGARLRELTHAYAVLSNPRSRLLYDRLSSSDGKSTDEWAQSDEEQLVLWVLGTEPSQEPSPAKQPSPAKLTFPARDLLVRYLAAGGFVISLLFLLVVLVRG